MAQISHQSPAEGALGFLDEEAVLLQLGEDEVDMAKVP
jgi:hypothetical protein